MPRLSIVVVVYDMRREALRTLHTLSTAHQRGVTAADYETLRQDRRSHTVAGAGDQCWRGPF